MAAKVSTFRCWLLVGAALVALLATGAVLMGRRSTSQLVRFEPSAIALEYSLVGTYRYRVILHNYGKTQIDGLRIGRSCGCIDEVRPNHTFSLPAGGELPVTFRMNHSRPEYVKQVIFVSKGEQDLAKVELAGKPRDIVLAPIASHEPVEITRLVSGSLGATRRLTLPLAAGVEVKSVAPGVSWLNSSTSQQGAKLSLDLSVSASAADGQYNVPIVCQFVSQHGVDSYDTTLPVVVRSRFHSSVPRIWFGKLRRGKVSSRTFELSGRDVVKCIRLVSDDPRLTIEATAIGTDRLKIVTKLNVGGSSGTFNGRIRFLVDGKPQGVMAVAALVA